jgi:putative redox protein
MVKMSMVYEGDLHCRLKHGPSGNQIVTDAPVDNQGKGAAFSPTDLTAASLGSCILTTMAIVARKSNINMDGATAEVEKEMVTEPVRRIGKISVRIMMPRGIPADKREFLKKIAHNCPVHKSLSPDVLTPLDIQYPD